MSPVLVTVYVYVILPLGPWAGLNTDVLIKAMLGFCAIGTIVGMSSALLSSSDKSEISTALGSLAVAIAWFVTIPALTSSGLTSVYIAVNVKVAFGNKSWIALPFSSVPPALYIGVGVTPAPVKVPPFSETSTSNTVVLPVLVTVYVYVIVPAPAS